MVLKDANLPWFGQILQEDQRFPQWMEAPTKRGRGRRSNPWWKGMIKHVFNFEENYFWNTWILDPWKPHLPHSMSSAHLPAQIYLSFRSKILFSLVWDGSFSQYANIQSRMQVNVCWFETDLPPGSEFPPMVATGFTSSTGQEIPATPGDKTYRQDEYIGCLLFPSIFG